MTLRLVRLAGLTVSFAAALLVAACSSLSGGQLTSMPDANSAQYGTGAIKVGLLTRDQSDDLGEGAPDSAFLAAQLDAETLAKSPITLVVRRYDGTAPSFKAAKDELIKAGVKLMIAAGDPATAISLAGEVGGKGVPVMSLGNGSDPKVNLYAFGMSGEIEAALMADEMRRRHYRSVVLVSNPAGTSSIFASQLASAITAVKIAVTPVNAADPATAVRQISTLGNAGQFPSAIVLVESAVAARALMKQVRTGVLANVPAVGVSSWAFEPEAAAAAGPGWYLAPEGNSIAAFSAQFRKIYNLAPTPEGALTHDLIVMATALPQLVQGPNPYAPEVLMNDQGFKGVTGKFWFTQDGQGHRNLLPVELAPGLAQPAT
jgi:hypothetical protein